MKFSYSDIRWRRARARAIRRDGDRCTVARLLGGTCTPGPLHGHHITPIREGGAPFHEDNIGTACAGHHPEWEALRRELVARRRRHRGVPTAPRCRHQHRSAYARELCERRMARDRGQLVA